jgi:small GTP-binding protein
MVGGANAQYQDTLLKVVMVGDSGVGKSSLLCRYTRRTFDQSLDAPVGVDFLHKRVTIDGMGVQYQLWDTAGQERFRTIMRTYYRGAQGIVLVYDVSSPSSFDNLHRWLDDISSAHSNSTCCHAPPPHSNVPCLLSCLPACVACC